MHSTPAAPFATTSGPLTRFHHVMWVFVVHRVQEIDLNLHSMGRLFLNVWLRWPLGLPVGHATDLFDDGRAIAAQVGQMLAQFVDQGQRRAQPVERHDLPGDRVGGVVG